MNELLAIKRKNGIIGRSPKLDRALSIALRVAPTDLTVLITGESGVGKEVFSKVIHNNSKRKHSPFIAINCGAIPPGTINSELFGHEKGSFTGALKDRKGYFETVDGGTIFLDEIGELPLDTQAYLLRILETKEFIPVGSSKTKKTNVRVITATNVDLLSKINQGKFREDLYYRINTVPIIIPPLRERKEDIPMLFRKFAQDFADTYRIQTAMLDTEAEQLLVNYDWPGNIRELKNITDQLSVLVPERLLSVALILENVPKLAQRNLPSFINEKGGNNFEEREILFKYLLDMKKDMNDLKSLVFELVKMNNLNMPNTANKMLPQNSPIVNSVNQWQYSDNSQHESLIINNNTENIDEVEDSLSLEDMEKKMIFKALKRHKGRRKDAALDLGISERTLYRKIKEYELDI